MNGVAAFITKQPDGNLRLIFNYVSATDTSDTPNWRHITLFTYNDYDPDALANTSLSDADFAQIGQNIVARLIALNEAER